jgi:profilin
MSWNAYLAELKTRSTGCAIISLQGAVCGTEGTWKAQQAEVSSYPSLIAPNSPAQTNGVKYNGEKFFLNLATDDTIVAQKGKTAIVLQKAKTVLVAAFAETDKFVVGDVSAAVAKVVAQLVSVGC